MISPWQGVGLVLALIGLMLGTLKGVERLLRPHPEALRKLMHVGVGMVVLTFPWAFRKTWPVVVLAATSAVALAAVKLVPRLRDGIGTVLTGVRRPTLGEVCFPISVGVLIVLSGGQKILFVVPMLILTLADAVAALVGIGYGKIRYITSDGLKSAEGSVAFLIIAFLSVHVPLLLFTDVGRTQTLLISALIAILSMLVEAVAARGLDNLLIPLGAFAFLRLYMNAPVHALTVRLAAAVLLVVSVLVWRRRSTLDDSALIACALFGYAAAMLGGPRWLVGPAVLFLVHLLLWPRMGQRRGHTVYAVVSVIVAGLFWLVLQAGYGGFIRFYFPYAVGFGAHLAIIGVSRIGVDPSSRPNWVRLTGSVCAGVALIAAQMIPVVVRSTLLSPIALVELIAGAGMCATLGALVFFRLIKFLYGPQGSDAAIHCAGFGCALIASILGAVVQGWIVGWV